MNTRILYAIIGIIGLLLVGLIIYNQNQGSNEVVSDQASNANVVTNEDLPTNTSNQNTNTSNVNTNATNQNTNTADTTTEGRFSDESDLSQGSVFEVKYNGITYMPANLTIKAGDTVVFKNDSTGSYWPASAPHPAHTDYPEFDAKKSLGAGQNFTFKFLKTGTWAYHDHLRPVTRGSITVQ
ncbi:MAG: cupredoxin domain-containing protein [bacterium]|nr:cupredoxin domain-containing protein [bacterium]